MSITSIKKIKILLSYHIHCFKQAVVFASVFYVDMAKQTFALFDGIRTQFVVLQYHSEISHFYCFT